MRHVSSPPGRMISSLYLSTFNGRRISSEVGCLKWRSIAWAKGFPSKILEYARGGQLEALLGSGAAE